MILLHVSVVVVVVVVVVCCGRTMFRVAYLQSFDGKLSPEGELVASVLTERGIPFESYPTEHILAHPLHLDGNELVVGDFDWTRNVTSQLGIPLPPPPDYPPCLSHLLHRNVWESTLGQVEQLLVEQGPDGEGIFIKPKDDGKAFSGLLASTGWMEYLLAQFPRDFPVWCSGVVDMVAEYRVYVVEGVVRATCFYKGDLDADLDHQVIQDAAAVLWASEEGQHLAGCSLDFAVVRNDDGDFVTALIEVNEGFSLGAYDGVSAEDYTDMLIARWRVLMAPITNSSPSA